MRATVRELVTLAACTAILFVGQIALAFLPNIEVVSLLIILYTLTFKKRVLWIIYGFALLEGMLYGFSFWWISYWRASPGASARWIPRWDGRCSAPPSD